jgi:hypothetical protein
MFELVKTKIDELVTVSHPFGFCSDVLGYDFDLDQFVLDGDGWCFRFSASQVIGITGNEIFVGLWSR